jgi:4-hydroxy-tetrahydrodipicolinate reductase
MAGIAVLGVTGRMGQSLLRALRESPRAAASPEGAAVQASRSGARGLELSGALASGSSGQLGRDAAQHTDPTGIRVTADAGEALRGAAVAVDFSLPESVAGHAHACREARVPLLVGVTGFDARTLAELEAAARDIAVLIAPNTSLGVAVLAHVTAIAARVLGESYDAEISEAHHRAKRDAPSGTALALGAAVARARGAELGDLAVYDRHGAVGPRKGGSIGFSVVRAGDIVGEHTVMLAADGERLELTHRATDRMVFARGALRAAEWLTSRPPGLYGMADVIALP